MRLVWRTQVRLLALAVAVGGCAAASARTANHTVPDTPAHLLERMNQALATRNYEGVFSHWQGGRVEMLRIIHRVQDGVVSERLASLDGSGREFIRSGATLTCYLPDRRLVLVEQRPGQESLVSFPTFDQAAGGNLYDIREIGHTRVNLRDTHVIHVAPRDQYRYGYRLWIDDATGMPIKTELLDAHEQVMEQIVFASLTLSSRIPDSAFRPEVSTEGFQWLRNNNAPARPTSAGADAPPAPAGAVASLPWSVQQLPPGFRMTVRSAQTLPGSDHPVDHVVFTDGFATVSVFVESHGTQQPARPETATVGSSSAFSTVVDGHKVTAVGEVPPETVRFIATQVRVLDPAAPTGPRGR
ncbi:MAG: MucB/RseB C-terminal domain-containing protein [Proteobacteria bacterium]|nr:MucB/RseB C-terminal domain-containing protein [Pseudomonadota bacterium]